jgi:hypothetical protein
MSKKYASKEFSSLPPYVKGIIVIGVLGGVGLIGYQIYKGIKKRGENKDARDEANSWKDERNKLGNPTLSSSEMKSMSNQLFVAMDGYGTDEDAVLSVFKRMGNDADFAGVVAEFDVKEISSGRGNPEPNYKGALLGALKSELSESWIKKINAALSSKGISYTV